MRESEAGRFLYCTLNNTQGQYQQRELVHTSPQLYIIHTPVVYFLRLCFSFVYLLQKY